MCKVRRFVSSKINSLGICFIPRTLNLKIIRTRGYHTFFLKCVDIILISCKYLTFLFSFSHSLGCLAAVRDPFVSCGDPSTPLMEEESNAALLLCYVALAFFRCRPSFRVHPSIMHIHGGTGSSAVLKSEQ